MTTRRPDEPPTLAALFEAERQAPSAPASVRAEVASRLGTTLGLTLGATAWPAATSTTPGTTASAPTGLTAVKTAPWIKAALIFALGAGAGATMHATLTHAPAPVPASVTAPPPAPDTDTDTDTDAATDTDTDTATAAVSATARATGTPTNSTARALHGPAKRAPIATDSLQAERELVDTARAALARGRGASALEVLARHAAEHPRGRLVQEREALAVVALAQLGRVAEARERAARFRGRWPHSFLLPAVDRASPPNP